MNSNIEKTSSLLQDTLHERLPLKAANELNDSKEGLHDLKVSFEHDTKTPRPSHLERIVIKENHNSKQEIFYPFLYHSVPEEFQLKAKNDLHETEENIAEGLQKLKECIRREKLFSILDDQVLMSFLRTTKFNFEKALKRTRTYDPSFRKIANTLAAMEMETIKNVIDSQIAGLLPYRDNHGRAIFYTRGYAWKKELFNAADIAACTVGLLWFALLYPLSSISGFCYICEAKVNALYDLFYLGNAIKDNVSLLFSSPVRIQRVEILNENSLVRFLYMAIRPLLPTKLKKRLFFHGNTTESLLKTYSPSILPYEFGGEMGPLKNDWYRELFLDFVQKLKSEMD